MREQLTAYICILPLFASYGANVYKLYSSSELGVVEIVRACGVVFFPLGIAMGVL